MKGEDESKGKGEDDIVSANTCIADLGRRVELGSRCGWCTHDDAPHMLPTA